MKKLARELIDALTAAEQRTPGGAGPRESGGLVDRLVAALRGTGKRGAQAAGVVVNPEAPTSGMTSSRVGEMLRSIGPALKRIPRWGKLVGGATAVGAGGVYGYDKWKDSHTPPPTGMVEKVKQMLADPAVIDKLKTAGLVGGGVLGAGALGAVGYNMLNRAPKPAPKKEDEGQSKAAAFEDGFLRRIKDHGVTDTKVATQLLYRYMGIV